MIEPTLYIIMREDVPDMNPGKGMAQAAHAQALFDLYDWSDHLELYSMWCREGEPGGGFGRTLVLTSPWEGMCDIEFNVANTGMVVDPTYPIRTYYGKVYTEALTTCMWAFPTNEDEVEYLKNFRLHP